MAAYLDPQHNPYPIQPVVKIGQNISVLIKSKWQDYMVDYFEPIPYSYPFLVNFGAVAAGATITKAIVAVLQLDELQLLHLRFRPLDDVSCALFVPSGQAKFQSKQASARVTRFTELVDPFLSSSTFFVIGSTNDPFMQIDNPTGYNEPTSYVVFWGFRYLLTKLDRAPDIALRIPAQGKES